MRTVRWMSSVLALVALTPVVSAAQSNRLFKDALFVREGRAMVPTPRARNLIDPVRRALRGLEVTLNELEAFVGTQGMVQAANKRRGPKDIVS